MTSPLITPTTSWRLSSAPARDPRRRWDRQRDPAVHGAALIALRTGAERGHGAGRGTGQILGRPELGVVLLRASGQGRYKSSPVDMKALIGIGDRFSIHVARAIFRSAMLSCPAFAFQLNLSLGSVGAHA